MSKREAARAREKAGVAKDTAASNPASAAGTSSPASSTAAPAASKAYSFDDAFYQKFATTITAGLKQCIDGAEVKPAAPADPPKSDPKPEPKSDPKPDPKPEPEPTNGSTGPASSPARVALGRVPEAGSKVVIGQGYKYFLYGKDKKRIPQYTDDIFVANQAMPNAFDIVWVFYQNGDIVRELTAAEISEYGLAYELN